MKLCRYAALLVSLLLVGCGTTSTTQHALPPHISHPVATAIATPHVVSTPTTPARPKQLIIPAIGIDALIETVGVTPGGNLATPSQNPWVDAGWFESGAIPGQIGSAVIDGHVDRPGGYPAVFWRLSDLRAGDIVTVVDARGITRHFRVLQLAYYPPLAAPLQEIFGNSGGTFLNLITCAGDWIPSQHQTTLRLVVYTVLVK